MKHLLVVLFFGCSLFSFSQPSVENRTEIISTENGFRLIRNGSPYFVNGAGGTDHLDLLKSIGGNSIRTWGLENAQAILDEAHAKGISVCLGLWVGHERHGFDYNDEYAVKAQLNSFKSEILKYKDHPALLMWGVGNEVDLFYKNFKVWEAIEDIAKMIKELDPNHPTMTVTAGIDPAEVFMIKEYCPSIDILGINTYGGIQHLSKAVRQYNWDKPYMVTEWGPYGHWESPMTSWGVAVEATSKEKAEFREVAYKSIVKDQERCLGSYAFLWGAKQEQTPTWYGLFTKDGLATQSVDVLDNYWKNSKRNTATIIQSFKLNGQEKTESVKVKKSDICHFSFEASDNENDELEFVFELMPESKDKKAGGDYEKAPEPISFNVIEQSNSKLSIKAPKITGAYRLFIYILDNHQNVATANIPFYVK